VSPAPRQPTSMWVAAPVPYPAGDRAPRVIFTHRGGRASVEQSGRSGVRSRGFFSPRETGTQVFFADPHSPWPDERKHQRPASPVLRQEKPTCRAGPPMSSRPSPTHSTTGPARSSAGRPLPKSSTSNDSHFNNPVLHELTQYTSAEFAAFTDSLNIRRSLGRTGTCYDNAWAEFVNGIIKVERVNRTAYPHASMPVSI
jgi:hypothetical protein